MPKAVSRTTTSAEDILADHTPPIRQMVESLRRIVQQAVPEAVESAHPVWRSINYNHPRSGYFCGIFPEQERINVAFEFGVLLPDPQKILVGNGKQVRYMRVKDQSDINESAFKALLQAAIDLPERRDVKLALIRAAAKPVVNTSR